MTCDVVIDLSTDKAHGLTTDHLTVFQHGSLIDFQPLRVAIDFLGAVSKKKSTLESVIEKKFLCCFG